MNAPATPPLSALRPPSEALQWQPGELKFARLDQALDPAAREALIKNLLHVLPAESVIVHQEGLKPYECDGLTGYRHLPAVVVLPHTEQQASQV
ncbi:MAG: FAD-binding oxidoreductase, partial [Burkholderiaceae bacterium]